MPEPACSASGAGARPQPSKSPITATLSAFGRPDGEARAGLSVLRREVRAELLVDAAVRPLGEEVDVDVAEEDDWARRSWATEAYLGPAL